MRTTSKLVPSGFTAALVTAVLVAIAPIASGQTPDPGSSTSTSKPANASPPPADLEPGVNTSAPASAEPPVTPQSVSPKSGDATSQSSPNTKGRTRDGTGDRNSSRAPSTKGSATTGTATSGDPTSSTATNRNTSRTAATTKSGTGGGKAQDRLELDTTSITGNRELPKVLYIVPWKRSDLGDLVGKPVNSLLDEVLAPVDRDVFKRQNRYYDALKPDGAAQPSGSPTDAGEKH